MKKKSNLPGLCAELYDLKLDREETIKKKIEAYRKYRELNGRHQELSRLISGKLDELGKFREEGFI